MFSDFVPQLQAFVEGLPPVVQFLGVALISAIPFVESYFGSAVGVLAGLPAPLAVSAAVVGNLTTMLLMVFGASAVRQRATANRAPVEPSRRQERIRRMLDRWGVPVVSLAGQTVLPSQIVAGTMVSLGAKRNRVIGWQVVSIILWGGIFATLATMGMLAFA
ncbi:hypothetical protein [Gulosibacter chungangensis]|uniref:Small multidrug efflux protein n=1 Tax=Gulosibacter chungangensis TaxID=979746 RepID=A0A7J5B8K6_9MICO|nr:hypothetical protein [Gulosibacter chungangensis]KAB1641680.1 hypothetical protein F8O05_12080 [Gulosibacter chungangensis]